MSNSPAWMEKAASPQDEIAAGRVPGIKHFVRFAERSSLTAAGGDETLWAANANLTIMTSAETFDIEFTNTTDGSGTTGATVLLITYLDADFTHQDATVVLDTSGDQTTSFSGLGIQRAVVVSTGSANKNANDITIKSTTGDTVQGIIPAGDSVTKSSVFHAEINTTPIMHNVTISANKSGGGSPTVRLRLKVYNRLVETEYDLFDFYIDTSIENTVHKDFPTGFVFSGRDVIWWTADTDTNNTDVIVTYSLNVVNN